MEYLDGRKNVSYYACTNPIKSMSMQAEGWKRNTTSDHHSDAGIVTYTSY